MNKIIKWLKNNGYEVYLEKNSHIFAKKTFFEDTIIEIRVLRYTFNDYKLSFYRGHGQDATLLYTAVNITSQRNVIKHLETTKIIDIKEERIRSK